MQEVIEDWNLASWKRNYPLGDSLSTLCPKKKSFNPGGDLALGSGRVRGTWQGRTIELRLEGRLLCLWGLLGGEVSLEAGELNLLPSLIWDLSPRTP